MVNLIYCKKFPTSPRDCSGIAYQITYDSNGNVNGAYRCNFCYMEKNMSEHSVLLATQGKVDRLELENAELHTHIIKLEKELDNLTAKLLIIKLKDLDVPEPYYGEF